MKKLGDAEIEIMKTLWKQEEPVTSGKILEELSGCMSWKLPSLMTALNRLAEKGFVCCDRSTRTNYYTAIISEQEYQTQESKCFLEKVFSNSFQKLVTNLYDSETISKKDLKELREWLDRMENEKYENN